MCIGFAVTNLTQEFIDGIFRNTKSAARALLLLAEVGQIAVTISEQVLAETERAIARKVPFALSDFRQAILASQAQIFTQDQS